MTIIYKFNFNIVTRSARTGNDTETVRAAQKVLMSLLRAKVPSEAKIYIQNSTVSIISTNRRRTRSIQEQVYFISLSLFFFFIHSTYTNIIGIIRCYK